MKHKQLKITHRLCGALMLLALLCVSTPAIAGETLSAQQSHEISGRITDESGTPLIGATVIVRGETMYGTTVLEDGRFSLSITDANAVIEVSFLGYQTLTENIAGRSYIEVRLQSESIMVSDVMVIGYGTQRRSDLTGSVASVSSDKFNTGIINSPEQLINGKLAGVQIVSNGGSPTSGSTIRIRGGASLNASNEPLIVLDGVPLETGGISGNTSNFLSLINPADIESMTVLKDASSTAIYGSRASNGVLLITTKKGSRDIRVSVNSTQSLQQHTRTAKVLSADEFRDVIMTDGNASQQALLGENSTKWNDEIFHLAYGTDNNASVSGSFTQNFPFRVSMGYFNQSGILKTDRNERYTGNISLAPSFLDNHLKLNLNVKGTINNNRFANASAIYSAAAYNPTIPVHSGSDLFGGFTEALDNTGTPSISGQIMNPLGLINQARSTSDITRIVGNFDIDYKMHFLPELRAHITLGYDNAEGKGKVFIPGDAAQYYTSQGRDYKYGPQKNKNKLLTAYLNYVKDIESINSRIDLTAGYDYQRWTSKSPLHEETNVNGEIQNTSAATFQRHVLLSYYARLNYSLASKYMLTATVRNDGSSRFDKDNRWSLFPSVAVAWRMSEENFLNDSKALSNLKLRLSYGQTGQQDGIGNYGYLPMYTISQDGAQYQFGDQFYYTYRPEAYVPDLKWETTRSYNIGVDFGFLNERISGSLDYYNRKTKDLLATVPSPAGSNFGKVITTNVGNMKSDGLELTINATPIRTNDWTWDVSYNMTWQSVKITNLSLAKGSKSTMSYVGQAFDDTYLQIMKEGYAPYTFYLHKQVYDERGKPIEGLYADLNNDGEINTADLYCANSPAPDVLMGFSSNLAYKNWTLGFSMRASLGNYAYNGTAMNMGALGVVSWNPYQINNLSSSYLKTGFKSRQYLSDYYLEDASFLKMDNISLGYNFGNVTKWCKLRVSAMVQNVFTITDYSGVDPEIYWGIESSFYPRARTYSLGLSLEF